MNQKYPATLNNLDEMIERILMFAKEVGMDNDGLMQLELGVEEALVNIIHYAYPKDKEGMVEIGLEAIRGEKKGVRIVIKDQGIAYNPLEHKREIDFHVPLEKRETGGFGIFFILKMMDKVDYQREEDSNILILSKFL